MPVASPSRTPDPMSWPAAEVAQAFRPLAPDLAFEFVDEIDSTNSELMRRAREGRRQPLLLVAGHQRAGRGRLGRVWVSRPGDSLTFSLGLPLQPRDWSGLSLAMGLAIAEALDPAVRIKWPNDLWLDGRKLGGLLVETVGAGAGADAARWLVVGVGLNLATGAAGADWTVAPAGLRERWPQADGPSVLARVAPALAEALAAFQAQGFAPLRGRYRARDALAGRWVTVSGGAGEPLVGQVQGVSDDGALLLRAAEGLRAIHSADVQVRPLPAMPSRA